MYPVLYLLNGYGGNNRDYTNGGIAAMMDTAIENGVKEMIIIMPDGMNSWYCNNYDSRNLQYEDFMVQELIPQAESKYHISSSKDSRAISGLSMGGYGATYHAFKYPEMYSSCYSMSGAVLYGGNEPNLQTLMNSKSTEQLKSLPAYTMEIGTEDFLYNDNLNFHNLLLDKNVPHNWITRPGIHEWAFWQVCLPKVLRFTSDHFGTSTNYSLTIIEDIQVYPNPATEWILVKTGSAGSVTLCDIIGNIVYKKAIENSEVSFYVGNLSRGVYLINIELPSRKVANKIILQ